MNFHVDFNLLALDKPPTADLALVRPLSSVDPDVCLEVVLPFELARTILAFVDACIIPRRAEPVQPTERVAYWEHSLQCPIWWL